MADLSITATSVVAGTGAKITHGTLGATVTAGQMGYLDSTTGTWKLADNDSATAAARPPGGMFLNGGAAGQPVAVATKGPVTLNAVLTAGVGYYLSSTPGGICPVADLGSGDYPSFIGFASSTTVLSIDIKESGVAL